MAGFSKMVDMAKDQEEVKEDIAEMSAGPKASVPVYPYGLSIALTEEELPKLGLDGAMPEVGEMIHIAAMAKVTSVSENEVEMSDGEKKRRCRIELQITHLATENEDEEDVGEARRKRFYDADDKAA